MTATILMIEDDKNFRQVVSYALKQAGYSVVTAQDGREGLAMLTTEKPDVVLCDVKMPVMDGMAFLAEKQALRNDTPVIMVTAFGSIEGAVEAMKAGAFDFVTKPINQDVLRMAVSRALERQALRVENRALRERVRGERSVDRLVGISSSIRDLRETIARLAESSATVLLRGESGVGKELAARALHEDGPRSLSGRFVVLNCAAVPSELLESELFGHRKGSFTGAHDDRVGKFEAADNGTIFLDEIGDMPLQLQAKLLRTLQEGEIERIGENKMRRVNVRVVAATNQPLEELVEEGRFRRDLFYRISVVPVILPPLRERPEDIEVLVRTILARHGAPGVEASADALDRLRAHRWPGNVRELENLLLRACALRPGLKRLEASDIGSLAATRSDDPISILLSDGVLELPEDGIKFEEIERRILLAAWEQSGHNQTRGAKLVGLPRQAFIYRLQKFGALPSHGDSKVEEKL
ncbi:sigma-54-dependent Fis family transcriptional regulator [Candidatus Sumerlaeota bacterium]|nr:sigma-54-dependent Fis family transcriptional regulator [Candidatus Sumerlaeota bacterium]